jgi:hypothetical protein
MLLGDKFGAEVGEDGAAVEDNLPRRGKIVF